MRAAREALGGLRKHLLPVLSERQLADLTPGIVAWRNSMVGRTKRTRKR